MKRIISYIFMPLIIGMMISPCIAKAQKNITGKVVDAISRQPLEAALVKTSNANAITNQYGNFSLKASANVATITVSFIGYKPLNVSTNNQQNITIALQPDVTKLEDVVVLQSGNQTKFASLAKIDLDLKPVRNTQELMRIVPGLFVAQHAGGGKAEQIFLRGFDCDHGTDIQVSVDGMPVNMVSHAHGQGYADAHFIIPETVNNIDFGTGPYYTQHGNLNTAGYVSFATYNNIPQSRVQVEVGRYNTFRTLAMLDLLKRNKDKQSAYIAADFNYTDGATINKQNFNRFNVFGKYNLAITNNTQLTASLSAFKSKWDASGQVPERAVADGSIDRFGSIDPSEGGNTERYNGNIILAHTFKNGMVWENQAFYSRYIFNLFSNFTFYLNDPINGDEINQKESRNLLGYTSTLHHKKNFSNWSLTSTYGVGIRYDATNNSELANVVKRQFLGDIKKGDITESNTFGFVQQQFSFGKWLIDAGVRLDYLHFNYFDKLSTQQLPSQGKAIVSPKLNIQYTLNSAVQAYIKAGKGFHSNDTRVVVGNKGQEILPAAYGGDIGLILKPTKNLLINIAAWYLYLDQEFVYVGDDGNVEPSGKTRREGIDVIARYQFNSHLFANVNLNFTKPRAIDELKGQDYIPLAPTATSTGGLFYKNKDGFNGSLSYRYIKNRPANEDNSIVAKGYFLLDGAINYTKRKYEIGLAMENILNVKWNEAQFATESRLQNEPIGSSVTELNFTPGTPFFIRAKLAVFFSIKHASTTKCVSLPKQKLTMKKAIVIIGILLISSLLFAHEYVLLAYKYKVQKGDTLEVHLFVADGFNIQIERPIQKAIIKKFELISKNGVTDLLVDKADQTLPVINNKVDFEGLGLIHMERDYARISLPTTKFKEYIKEDHLENIDVTNDAATKMQRERYTRYLKTLVQSGKDSTSDLYKKIIGQNFEIVLLQNPYLLRKGDVLKAQILFMGKPLANKTITARNRIGSENTMVATSRTDAKGICSFKILRQGEWFLHATHMIICPDKTDSDWESFWTSYSFQVG